MKRESRPGDLNRRQLTSIAGAAPLVRVASQFGRPRSRPPPDDSDARDEAELIHLNAQLVAFINHYNPDHNPIDPEARRTVIFFPGGMASSLIRARHPYDGGQLPTFFDNLWLTPSIFLWSVRDLAMTGDADSSRRFVIPSGSIKILTYDPYRDFYDWCARKGLDLFVFGYDWRRRPEDTIRFFFEKFLPELGLRARRKFGSRARPLDDLTLLGHSLGGMLVKLIMNNPAHAAQVTRAITVGSPFYGYAGQTIRFFEGESDFFPTRRKELARIISSLRGGYYLQYLDSESFDRYGPRLAAARTYPRRGYPSVDAETHLPADPFDPMDGADGRVRYPDWVDRGELRNHARDTARALASDLPGEAAAKFYNLRGVRFENGTVNPDTPDTQYWSLVPKTFDPQRDPVPFTYDGGPGDQCLPAWSTRLIGLEEDLPDQVTTFEGELHHVSLMELPEIQSRIFQILQGVPPAQRTIRVAPRAAASGVQSSLEVRNFVRGIVPDPTLTNAEAILRARIDRYLATTPQAQVDALARGMLASLITGSELRP